MKKYSFSVDCIKIIIAGIIATFLMDFFNKIGALLDIVFKIDLRFLGGLFYRWSQGEFSAESPAIVMTSGGTKMMGLIGHYFIGIAFSMALYVVLRLFKLNRVEVDISAILFGMAAALISLLFIFPSVDLGIFGWKVGFSLLGGSVYNHLGFGIGLAFAYRLCKLESS